MGSANKEKKILILLKQHTRPKKATCKCVSMHILIYSKSSLARKCIIQMSMHTNYGHPCITLPILYSKLMSRPFPSFFSLVRQSSHSSEAVYVPPLLFCPKQMRRPFSPFYSLVRLSESFPQKQCTSFFKNFFKGISSLFLTNDPVTSIAFAF